MYRCICGIPALPACECDKKFSKSKKHGPFLRRPALRQGTRTQRSEIDQGTVQLLHKGEYLRAKRWHFFFHSLSVDHRATPAHHLGKKIRNQVQASPTQPWLASTIYIAPLAQIVPYLRNPIELSLSECIQVFLSSSFHLWCPTFIHIFIYILYMTRPDNAGTIWQIPQPRKSKIISDGWTDCIST